MSFAIVVTSSMATLTVGHGPARRESPAPYVVQLTPLTKGTHTHTDVEKKPKHNRGQLLSLYKYGSDKAVGNGRQRIGGRQGQQQQHSPTVLLLLPSPLPHTNVHVHPCWVGYVSRRLVITNPPSCFSSRTSPDDDNTSSNKENSACFSLYQICLTADGRDPLSVRGGGTNLAGSG
jgi:hypothetical protein